MLISTSFEEVLGTFQYPHAEVDLRKYFTLYERPDGSGRQVLKPGHAGRLHGRRHAHLRALTSPAASPASAASSSAGRRQPEAWPHDGPERLHRRQTFSCSPRQIHVPRHGRRTCSARWCSAIRHGRADHQKWRHNKYRVAPGFRIADLRPRLGPAPIALDFAFPVAWQARRQGRVCHASSWVRAVMCAGELPSPFRERGRGVRAAGCHAHASRGHVAKGGHHLHMPRQAGHGTKLLVLHQADVLYWAIAGPL